MKKLKEYKTFGCHFTVYDEGIEIHKMTNDRFIKKSDIADVTIKKITSRVSFRVANTKEVVVLSFSVKDIQNKEDVRVGEYLQGKSNDEVFIPLVPNDVAAIQSVAQEVKKAGTKDEEFSIAQLIVGLVILALAGLFIWGVFKEDETVPTTAQVETTTEEVKTDKPTVEPIIQIVTLYNIPMSKLSEQFATPLNSVGNLIVDTDEYKLLIESKSGVKSDYVELQLKSLGSCTKSGVPRNSEEALRLVGLKPDLKGNPTNPPAGIANGAIEYCDYPNSKFVPGVTCSYDGGYYDVSLSPRTYCKN